MKSGAGNAGNVHMRGRGKLKLMSCECCYVYDDREELRERIALREMKAEIDEQLGGFV